jgi:hypothetical protein
MPALPGMEMMTIGEDGEEEEEEISLPPIQHKGQHHGSSSDMEARTAAAIASTLSKIDRDVLSLERDLSGSDAAARQSLTDAQQTIRSEVGTIQNLAHEMQEEHAHDKSHFREMRADEDARNERIHSLEDRQHALEAEAMSDHERLVREREAAAATEAERTNVAQQEVEKWTALEHTELERRAAILQNKEEHRAKMEAEQRTRDLIAAEEEAAEREHAASMENYEAAWGSLITGPVAPESKTKRRPTSASSSSRPRRIKRADGRTRRARPKEATTMTLAVKAANRNLFKHTFFFHHVYPQPVERRLHNAPFVPPEESVDTMRGGTLVRHVAEQDLRGTDTRTDNLRSGYTQVGSITMSLLSITLLALPLLSCQHSSL